MYTLAIILVDCCFDVIQKNVKLFINHCHLLVQKFKFCITFFLETIDLMIDYVGNIDNDVKLFIGRKVDIIIIWRQFITSQFQFEREEYAVNSLHIEEFTKIGGDDDSEYNYTTIYSGNEEVITYAGTKKQIQHLVPELLIEKSDSDDIDEVATQQFWSDFSKES